MVSKPFISCLLLILLFHLKHASSTNHPALCHEHESSALLNFKNSFLVKKDASEDDDAYPKTESWNLRSSTRDCCNWDGVECHKTTGYVIGLDLSSSWLYGSMRSNSSLFQLLHLQTLNLADNDFNGSEIPSAIGRLSRLTHLNLSVSYFSGQIPPQILQLNKLVSSLDISSNRGGVRLQNPGLKTLVESLPFLQILHLSNVNMSSPVPQSLANLTSLTSLFLKNCSLQGEFPSSIFNLPHLQELSIRLNPNLTGILPEFHPGTRLRVLALEGTGFTGKLPDSIGNLKSLEVLDIRDCRFSGSILASLANLTELTYLDLSNNSFYSKAVPSWLGKLTQLTKLALDDLDLTGEISSSISNLTHLNYLSLSFNHLTGQIPLWLGNLKSLEVLDISDCRFAGFIPTSLPNLTELFYLDLSTNSFSSQTLPSWLGKLTQLTTLALRSLDLKGEIPSSISNLTHLNYLSLKHNQLTGPIPLWLGNLTQLTVLDFSQNNLQGQLPASIFGLLQLQHIWIGGNNLSGVLELDRFLKLSRLTVLVLSRNTFSILSDINITEAALPKMRAMGLGSCNLSKFPYFLRNQTQLEFLDLSDNNIQGQIPRWIWGISSETLIHLLLDSNALTGFEEQPLILPWKQLQYLKLNNNRFQGTLLIPPPSVSFYDVGHNSFTGNLPLEFCSFTGISFLDMSHNNLSGIFPRCFGNLSRSLVLLNLNANNFYGSISQTFESGCQLREIRFSQNLLSGRLPRSLANCQMLEILDIANNQINDSFPQWLGTLPNLKVLNLGANQFHGVVGGLEHAHGFSSLQIIDISHNSFTGNFPEEYFQHWDAMKASKGKNVTYLDASYTFEAASRIVFQDDLSYTTKLTAKGVEMEINSIFDLTTFIDFSNNRFNGAIPESITNLKVLQSLNLSNNYLTGQIPANLKNLVELESLDLSHNQLSGQIPVELKALNSLAIFNVAYNNLSGPIPHGNQFNTFQNNSYLGNSKLCGDPLSKQCYNIHTSPPSPKTSEKDDFDEGSTTWVVISMGYASGLVIGVVIGWALTARKREWFVETFGTGIGIGRKQRKCSTGRR